MQYRDISVVYEMGSHNNSLGLISLIVVQQLAIFFLLFSNLKFTEPDLKTVPLVASPKCEHAHAKAYEGTAMAILLHSPSWYQKRELHACMILV